MSFRRFLSHILSISLGVYGGLLLNSHVSLDSVPLSMEHFQAPLLRNECNEESSRNESIGVPMQQTTKKELSRYHNKASDKAGSEPAPASSTHAICQLLQPIPSTLGYWTQHIPQIHAATQLTPYDTRFQFHDFTAQLLHLISPRLPHSVLSVTHDWTTVQRVLNKAQARYEYLKDSSNKSYQPPVNMVIMGGSVLVGRNCRKLMKILGVQGMLLPNRACTWAYRLQIFFNQLFGVEGVFKVTKISMGGTNSAVGTQIFQYDLLPEEARNPDIVLNAYSTNDMHILTVLQAQSANTTLRDLVFEMTQQFVRVVLQNELASCRKAPPLLLHLDDYLGNEQRQILETTELSQGVHVLASYYGIATMSFANVVRPFVYGDTKETWFSPDGWYSGGDPQMMREIHPGMGMHIATTWAVAYNLLNLVMTYCSMEPWLQSRQKEATMNYSESFMSWTVPLRGEFDQVPGKPRLPPRSLPPLMTPDLSLETISKDWHAMDKTLLKSMAYCGNEKSQRCIFSWVSGMSQQQNNQTWVKEYFGARQVVNKGWKLVDDGDKLGFSPSQVGDEIIWDFSISQTIHAVALFTLKSYGEKWENSRLLVSIKSRSSDGEWKEAGRNELVGFHDKETSEMYTSTITLSPNVEKASSLRVHCQLKSGMTFKIMGLAVCS